MVVLNLIIIIAALVLGERVNKSSPLHSFYWPGVILKILAGLSVGLLYSYYYNNGDSFTMFSEAIKLKNASFISFKAFVNIYLEGDYSTIDSYHYLLQPRAAFMSKILALIALIANDNYWLTSIYLSIFSFAGFWMLANSIYSRVGIKWKAVLPTLFFPSIVFWTSGVLKESIAIGALAGVIALIVNAFFSKKISFSSIIAILVGFFLIASLKYYYAAALVVSILSLFITRLLLQKGSKKWLEGIVILVVFCSLLSLASLSHINFWPSRFLSVIIDNYDQFQLISEADNLIVFNNFEATIFSFIINSPKALFAGLFYPLWSGSFNILKTLSIIENWALMLLFLYSLQNIKLPEVRDSRLILWAMVLFIGLAAIFITYSTPNIGTLVRYRVGYLLVFVIIIFNNIRFKQNTI